MMNFAVFYIEALVVCMIMFVILLMHNRSSIDRQEKQIKFDRALIAFILYFTADIFWAALEGGFLAKTRVAVVADTFALYVLMAGIVYFWMEYALAVEQAPHRNRPVNRFAVLFPFLVTTVILILNYVFAPQTLINDKLEIRSAFSIYLMVTPVIYLAAVLFYTLRQARKEEDRVEKRKHLFIGMLPVLILLVGMAQELFFPKLPIYCFADSLLMLIFYIQSIDDQVSLDPLTKLNNRGQLRRYVSQKANLEIEGRMTVVVMLDVNDFKLINDTYGHAEGDRALVLIADALRKVVSDGNIPAFLCRYGGDEFTVILHPTRLEEVEQLITRIREELHREAESEEKPYDISIAAGYDELLTENETIQDCVRRADEKLYEDKRIMKGL